MTKPEDSFEIYIHLKKGEKLSNLSGDMYTLEVDAILIKLL